MKEIKKIYGQFGFVTLLIVISGLAVHLGFFAFETHNLEGISHPMVLATSMLKPSFLSETFFEILFSIMILAVWSTMQKTLGNIHTSQIEREKHLATIRAYQEVMSLMAESVGRENNKILSKIQFRKARGQNVSPTIETASRNIAMILSALSRTSYSEAYLSRDPASLQKMLRDEVQLALMQPGD